MDEFTVKDSGQRLEFDSGMRRDVTDGKVLWSLIYSGPMLERWAQHLTAGAEKYGPDNWLLAQGEAELQRFRDSAARHFAQWMRGDRDEDHAAAVFFNLNGAEYVRDRMAWALDADTDDRAVAFLNAGTDVEPQPAPRDEPQTATVAAIAEWAREEGMDPKLAHEALMEMLEDGDAVIVGFDPEEGPILATRSGLEDAGIIEPCVCSPAIYRLVVTDEDSPVTGRVLNGSYSDCNSVWYAFPPGTDPRGSGLLYEFTNDQI